MFRNRSISLLFFILFSTSFLGCARTFTLDIGAGACLNPPDEYCDDQGAGSRVIEVRIYQLKTYVDPKKLDWQQFLRPGDTDMVLLKGALTDPTNPGVRTILTVQAKDERLEYIVRLKKTKFLLIVTVGRHQGEHSIELVPLTRWQKEERLYFEYYDVDFRNRDRNREQLNITDVPGAT